MTDCEFMWGTEPAQKIRFSINDFFSKFDQTRSFLRIWTHLLWNLIFCAVRLHNYVGYWVNMVHCAIWYQASVYNFTKINSPPWVFFTIFKLYIWYQIAQRITNFLKENSMVISVILGDFKTSFTCTPIKVYFRKNESSF